MRKLVTVIIIGIFVFTSCKEKKESQIPDGAFPIVYTGHLYIKGTVDSIKGNYVFDTGAFNLYFDSTYYADNGFAYQKYFDAELPGAGCAPQMVKVIEDTVQFHLGKDTYKTSIVPILQLKPILGDFADGILGMEYFYNSVLEINYEKEYMKQYQSIDSVDIRGWSSIKLTKKDDKLYIPIQVVINDSVTISGEYQLDFGSGGTVSLTSLVAGKYKLEEKIKNKVPYYTKYGGVGGESSSYDFFAKSVKIGDFKFDNVIIDFSVDSLGAMASEKHLGLVGNELYERFHVCIDFVNNILYLTPNKKYNEPFDAPRLGFSYIDRGETLKSWIVTGLYQSSNAEKSGLKIDDKIITVNGINVSEINYERKKTFFEDIEEVRLRVERGGNIIEITFNLKAIITTANIV